MQSESHQVLNIKGKGRQLQLYSHKSTDGEQSAAPSPKGDNSVT